jgi:hypothetical protein
MSTHVTRSAPCGLATSATFTTSTTTVAGLASSSACLKLCASA